MDSTLLYAICKCSPRYDFLNEKGFCASRAACQHPVLPLPRSSKAKQVHSPSSSSSPSRRVHRSARSLRWAQGSVSPLRRAASARCWRGRMTGGPACPAVAAAAAGRTAVGPAGAQRCGSGGRRSFGRAGSSARSQRRRCHGVHVHGARAARGGGGVHHAAAGLHSRACLRRAHAQPVRECRSCRCPAWRSGSRRSAGAPSAWRDGWVARPTLRLLQHRPPCRSASASR